ncbi:hypothetical protein RUM43_001653 [Polyplax serrata]|uniref:Protein transport protein Sec61 subunit gamma n=1 Tax=Polyplax serrata TaxID=468196 RepID=A0AAN8SEN3_POLSC
MDQVTKLVEPGKQFAKDSIRLVKRCTKPDRKEFQKIAVATAIGFCIMGFIGFFGIIKLENKASQVNMQVQFVIKLSEILSLKEWEFVASATNNKVYNGKSVKEGYISVEVNLY